MKARLISRCLLALLLSVPGATAESQPVADSTPAFTVQGAFFAIVTTNLDASVHWYESHLGLRVVKRGKSPRLPAETVVLGGHNMFVELIHHDGNQLSRVDSEASEPRLLKAGGIVGQKDFDVVAAYLDKRGVEAGVFDDKEMGVRCVLFKDNEGNLIQLFTQTP